MLAEGCYALNVKPATQDRITKVLGTILGVLMVLAILGWGIYKLWVVFVWW